MFRSIRVLVVEDVGPFSAASLFRAAGSAGLTVVNTDEMRTPVSEGIQYSAKWCAAWAIPFVVMLIYVSASTFRKSFRSYHWVSGKRLPGSVASRLTGRKLIILSGWVE